MLRTSVSASLLGLVMVASSAQASSWDVDPAHSTVGFSVRHLGVSNVRGAFKTFTGSIELDDKDVSKSKIDVSIDMASVNTENGKRDDHLRSPEFFDAKQFPKMTFTSAKIQKAKGGFKVTGDLTLHGVTKPVVLNVEGDTKEVKDPWGGTHLGFSATTTINRKDFGLVWSKLVDDKLPVVGDDVKINLDIELTKKADAEPKKT